jgi:hypothetical protein
MSSFNASSANAVIVIAIPDSLCIDISIWLKQRNRNLSSREGETYPSQTKPQNSKQLFATAARQHQLVSSTSPPPSQFSPHLWVNLASNIRNQWVESMWHGSTVYPRLTVGEDWLEARLKSIPPLCPHEPHGLPRDLMI